MHYSRNFALAVVAGSAFFWSACHSDVSDQKMKGNGGAGDTASSTRKISVVISSIPFPSNILDTLHSVNAKYDADLTNPVGNINLYSESNIQAINLGVYGADLAYVISFEQFQSVGIYMKSTKFLADYIGIPLAFTEQVIQRCEKNQNNKDSLTQIEFQSYNVIDQTLKQNQRTAAEVLVLMGGWVEGAYLTTQGLITLPTGAGRQKVFGSLLQQKQYIDKLITLLNDVSSTPYCQQLIAPMQEIKAAFEPIQSAASFNDEILLAIGDKIKDLRSHIIKGGA
jgi:hypothetical protein